MEAIESARFAHSDGMGAYTCFMSVRLLEMRRVLKESGRSSCTVTTRPDSGNAASAYLRVKVNVFEPAGPKMSRSEMYDHLLDQYGPQCRGCDRMFDDPRYLELDHNTPRSDGGLNHVSNRILLCGPCNRLKSNTLTLSGLRKKNKQNYVAESESRKLREIADRRRQNPGVFDK